MQDQNITFKLKVITPKQTLFQGEAVSLSSVNSQGKFDILAQHANFITLIEDKPIDVELPDKKKLQFKFSRAIIYNYQNSVSIFAEPLSS
jgi:F0F1-type ATP synthase epsilon subunit